MVTFQVFRHVFDVATKNTVTTKVGKPQLRTKAQATRDSLNEKALKEMDAPANTGKIVSFSCTQCAKSLSLTSA